MGVFWTIAFIGIGFALMRFGKELQRRHDEYYQRSIRQEREMIEDALRHLDEVRAESQEKLNLLKPQPDDEERAAESVLEDFKDMLYMTKGGRFGG